jgi:uncharacterized protein
MFGLIRDFSEKKGITTIADGTNLTDLDEYRPGNRAAAEAGIRHPFVEAGIGKNEIREIAGMLMPQLRDLPSSACLASRIPYYEILDSGKLCIIEDGENILKDAGFSQCRLRLHDGQIARIEVPAENLADLLSAKDRIMPALRTLGIRYVTVDLGGYRTGGFDRQD